MDVQEREPTRYWIERSKDGLIPAITQREARRALGYEIFEYVTVAGAFQYFRDYGFQEIPLVGEPLALLSMRPAPEYMRRYAGERWFGPSVSVFDISRELMTREERADIAKSILEDILVSEQAHRKLPATARLHSSGVLYTLSDGLVRQQLEHHP